MPTGEETEVALGDMEQDYPDEVGVVRARLRQVSEDRPLHSWLREAVEALTASSRSLNDMTDRVDTVVPGLERVDSYLSTVVEEEKKRTDLLLEDAALKKELALKQADRATVRLEGLMNIGHTVVKHPAFWAAISSFVTYFLATGAASL